MPRRRAEPYIEHQYGPNRYSWLVIGNTEFVIYDGKDKGDARSDPQEEEALPSYADGLGVRPLRLSLRRLGGRPFTLSLTYYTVKELQAIQAILNDAFKLAIQRSMILDEAAARETASGNDSIPRVYRPDPQIVVRPSALTRLQNETTVVVPDPE